MLIYFQTHTPHKLTILSKKLFKKIKDPTGFGGVLIDRSTITSQTAHHHDRDQSGCTLIYVHT
jgi:hypothetical protein